MGDSPSLSPSHTHTHTLSFLMHISHLGSGMLSQIITGGLSLASLVTALCGGAEAEAAAEAARVSGGGSRGSVGGRSWSRSQQRGLVWVEAAEAGGGKDLRPASRGPGNSS